MVSIETNRLILREFQRKDLHELAPILADPKVMKFSPTGVISVDRGLATEAASAVIKYGFKQFDLPYILGIVERANLASVRVLEKVGMRHEKTTIFHEVEMDVYRVDTTAKLPNEFYKY